MTSTFFISLIDSCFNSFRNKFLKQRKQIEYIDLAELRGLIKSELFEYFKKNETESGYVDLNIICYELTGARLH